MDHHRQTRETVKSLFDEPRLLSYITIFRDGLWPGGQLRTAEPTRTAEARLKTKEEANRKLSALIPGTVTTQLDRTSRERDSK